MKATQLKVSRKWNSMMMGLKMQGKNGMFTPPTYSHIYKLKTVQQSNDKGTWFGWDVARVGPINDPGVYKIAKDFGTNVAKGAIEAKHESDTKAKRQGHKFIVLMSMGMWGDNGRLSRPQHKESYGQS